MLLEQLRNDRLFAGVALRWVALMEKVNPEILALRQVDKMVRRRELGGKLRRFTPKQLAALDAQAQQERQQELAAHKFEKLGKMGVKELTQRIQRNIQRQQGWFKRGIAAKLVGTAKAVAAEKEFAAAGTGMVTVKAHTATSKETGKTWQVRQYTRKGREKTQKAMEEGMPTNIRALTPDASGVSGTYKVDAKLNGDVVKCGFKPGNEEENRHLQAVGGPLYLREIAVPAIADQLGLGDNVPVVVPKTIASDVFKKKGGPGALMEWANGGLKTGEELFGVRGNKGMIDYLDKFDGGDHTRVAQLAALDYLTGNLDRKPGNWLADKAGTRIMLIDHGASLAEVPTPYGFRSNFGAWAKDRKISVKTIGKMLDNKWDSIEKVMKSSNIGSKGISYAKSRYDELVSAAKNDKTFADLKINVRHGPVVAIGGGKINPTGR